MSPEQRTLTEVDGRRLSLSNLDKVLYPAAGFTKAEVISYYLHIAPVMLPHLAGRPVTFTRYPDGVDAKSFFEKHVKKGAPGVGSAPSACRGASTPTATRSSTPRSPTSLRWCGPPTWPPSSCTCRCGARR